MWDIRDGMCKQTFSGHESDINAIAVRYSTLYSEFDKLKVTLKRICVVFLSVVQSTALLNDSNV